VKRLAEVAPLLLFFFLLLLLALPWPGIAQASAFVYCPMSACVSPASPPVVLLESDFPLSFTGISRTRGAVTYTDFESYPVPGWAASGGAWSLSTSGYKGNALRGADNNGGLGGASHYYYNTDLSSYASLWASVKTRREAGGGWYGISMMNSGRNRLYTVEIYTGGGVEVWSFNVEVRNGWSRLGSATIANYDSSKWYVIVVNYEVTASAVSFYVWVYDANGDLVASLTASSTSRRRFTPAYMGVDVDGTTALFEDFLISTSDPRTITVSGLPGPGYAVAIYDDLGNVVSSTSLTGLPLSVVSDAVVGRGFGDEIVEVREDVEASNETALSEDFSISTREHQNATVYEPLGPDHAVAIYDLDSLTALEASTETSVSLSVVSDAVVGRGFDGRIVVAYPNGFECLVYSAPAADAILGGDSYSLSYSPFTATIGPNNASASATIPISGSSQVVSGVLALRVRNVDAKAYYARLLLDPSSTIASELTLNATLASSPTAMASPIRISSGNVSSDSTGWLALGPGSTAYVYLSGYHSSTGRSSTLRLLLQYCTLENGGGACVFYPITLVLTS